MVFRIYDVGGQRSEKRKWLCLFDCVHAVSDLGNTLIKINIIIWPSYFVVEVTAIFAFFDQQPVSLPAILNALDQRVFNDLWLTRLSRVRMIWLLIHPLSPFSRQQLVYLSQSPCVSPVELTARTGGGRWAKSRESLALYKSFNTLWDVPCKAVFEGRLLCEPDVVHSEAVRRLQPEQDARGHQSKSSLIVSLKGR